MHRRFTRSLLMSTALVLGLGAYALPVQAQTATQKVKGSAETCTNPNPNHAKLAGMTVGFSQSENEQNPFRAGETNSVKSEAQKLGVKLLYTNANDNQAKQVADVESMISQGAQALIIAPLNATGLQPALAQAAAKNIPVVTIDRQTAGTFCKDFITFMGSDFYEQGVRAADVLAKTTKGKVFVVDIQGAYGNSVETQRTDGFNKEIKKYPRIKLVAQQTGNWSTTDAQKVMEQLLLAHPNINAVYAQADVMALGAMTAIKQAGKKPGKDVAIISIDGTKDLVQAIADGQAQADVETNPRFGPAAFQALQDWFNGKPVPQKIIVTDHLYTAADAANAIKTGAPY